MKQPCWQRSLLKQHQCEPADTSNLEIEIRTSVTHTITLKKVRQWLEGGARSHKEAISKERLRDLLCSAGFKRAKRKRPD
jgi:hypothetical protein